LDTDERFFAQLYGEFLNLVDMYTLQQILTQRYVMIATAEYAKVYVPREVGCANEQTAK
jgi:hypothetical protein